MITVILSLAPPRLRGALTLWLAETAPGVYVGRVNARIRDAIWHRILDDIGRGRAIMIWSTDDEQGYDIRTHNHNREIIDHDGLKLVTKTRNDDDGEGITGWSREGRRRRYG